MSSRPQSRGLPKALGAFSVGLGTAQMIMPGRVSNWAGLAGRPPITLAQRVVGIRELGAGAGLFGARRPGPFLWARVGGDVVDVALMRRALRNRRATQDRDRARLATAALVGIGLVDLVAAMTASRRNTPGRSAANEGDPSSLHLTAVVTINKPADELYDLWRDLESLPSFMAHVQYVEQHGTRSHWVASAPAGRTVEWDAELTREEPGSALAWRSLPGAQIANSGTVTFAPAPGDRGTEVRVELDYTMPAGRLGMIVAKLFGEEPHQQVSDDLKRFKQIAETGEVVVSEGTPTGARTSRQLKQRPAQPVSV